MARSYDQIFAATAPKSIVANTPASRENFTPASLWANVGYETEVLNEKTNEMETRFVSIQQGIPLDTMKQAPGTSDLSNARNALAARLIALGATMEPGTQQIVHLKVQLHRVGDTVTAIPTPETNPFVREFDLV